MRRVKFYSKEDMASGYNLQKAEIIIDNFDSNKVYTDINEIVEFYNIYQYIENEVFLRFWDDNYIKSIKNIAEKMKFLVYKWFNTNINNKNILSEYQNLEKIYKNDFFKILNDILDNVKINKNIFKICLI